MKRPLLGFCILLALLLSSICIWWAMMDIHRDIAGLLTQAQTAAEAENWQQAEYFSSLAAKKWEHHHRFTASFADHTPMDELDSLFAELEVFLQNRESPHFESTCAQLILLAHAMADSHNISWWNVL